MIFSFRQFDIRHRDSLLKVNTDAVLLGALIQSAEPVKTILDIGTGCGIIALMAAQKFTDAKIDAIEIDQASCDEAVFNFENSKFSSRLKGHHQSLQEYEMPGFKYDLILSNPPYFESPQFSKGNNLQDIRESRKKSATQYSLSFEELILHSSMILHEEGKLWLIIPTPAKEKIEAIGRSHKLFLQKDFSIRSKPGSDVIRSVLCFGFNELICETSALTIYNSDGTRHAEYVEITMEYYL